MSTRRNQTLTIIPSVLDRLLDDEPANTRDSPRSRYHDLRQLKQAVARDLEALLNTRRETLEDLPADLPHAARSILAYGIPDFTAFGLASPDDRADIRRRLEAAIETYETRLTHVKVLLEEDELGTRALRFRVDAMLEVDPAREPVRFDAMLQMSTHQYMVREGD